MDNVSEDAVSCVSYDPHIPGTRQIFGVLTPDECRQIIDLTEEMGYREDAPVSLGRDVRFNENVVWFPDNVTLNTIYQRMLPHLPKTMDGGRPPAGLNARFRCYRYSAGGFFKPHYDGSWPGSLVVEQQPNGNKVVHDAFGDRWSTMTALFYLNDDFKGGETRFMIPHHGTFQVQTVQPTAGSVLLFHHGEMPLSPLHESAVVTPSSDSNEGGEKYIVRTDVLYLLENDQPNEPQTKM